MSILPLASPGQALGAVAVAGSAASLVGGAFADLLAAFRPDVETSAKSQGEPEGTGAAEPASRSTRRIGLKEAEEKLRGRLDSLLAGFHSVLCQMMSEKGVDFSGGATLEADSLGGLRVVGDHPHKGIIETTLAGHPELAEVFRQIETNASVLGAVRSANEANFAGGSQEPFRVRVEGARAVCLAVDG